MAAAGSDKAPGRAGDVGSAGAWGPRLAGEPAADHYRAVRGCTDALCAPLAVEDHVAQSMPEASPAKWHLAHTTWFFERFVLEEAGVGYRCFDPTYEALCNSYYQSIGPTQPRAMRGLMTRPT